MKQSTFSAQVANKFLTVLQGYSKTIRLLLVMLLTLTVTTNAWGADVVYKTAKFGSSYNSSKVSSYTSSWYSTYDGFRVDIVNANNNNNGWSYIKMGSKNAASTGTITTNAKIDAAITKVSLTIDAITANNITSITLKTATSSNGTYTSVGTFSKAKGTQTVTLASPTANLFYKIEVVCTKGSNNGLIQISQVDYYKSDVVATPEYNITYVGDDHITYSGTKPETITKEDGGFELEFSVNDGYQLDDVQVKMGGQDLVLDEDYLWEEGYLLILPETDITGDVEIIFETVATCTAPTITTQPSAATYTKGATATALKVVVSGTNLTYQWYSNTSNSTNGATKISGATSSTYTPSTSTVGTKYYYCIVSSGSCSTTSNIVSVVVNNPPFTVTLVPGSGSVTSTTLTETSAGAGVTLPTPTLNGCDEWTFAGWKTTSAVTTETTTKPTLIPAGNYKPTANTTLYAVYQRTEETEGNGSETEVTKSVSISNYATANNWTNDTKYTSVTIDENITATASTGTNTGKYYTSGTNWRFYQTEKATLTLSAATGCTIKTIKVTYSVSNTGTLTYSGSNVASNTVTTINATSATFGVGNTGSATNGQVRITAISVTYTTTSAGGTITTTYYHSTPDCGGDDPEPTGYTITFEANGGTKIDKIENATTLPTSLPTTTRDHYTFAGWFTNEGCTQTATAGATINANTTLYAKWTPVTYTVTFDAGSGTCGTTTMTGNFETGLELPTATPCDYASTNGWSFVGWSETTVSETTVRPAIHTGNYKPTKTITLHAVYAKTSTAQGGANEFILSLQYESNTYYVGQTFSDGKLSAETEQANAARFTIEDNYLHYEGGYISHKTTNANLSKVALKDSALVWSINESDSISFTSTVANTRGLAFNYNSGNPRFAAYVSASYPHKFTKTSVSGGNIQVTTYNSNPACEAPVDPNWVAATITHTAIKANCGSTTVLDSEGENGPATISFSGTYLQNSVTVTASDGFLVSINKTNDAAYSNTVTVNPVASGENQGKITQNVHVIADATAKNESYTGTITLTGADITNGSQVINVTAAVTCTQYTITWSVNGDDSHQVTYSPGDALQLPSIPVTPCDGMNHVGWTDNMGYDHGTDILFTETTDMTVTSDKTYYAVFATPTSSGGGETTLDFSEQGYANQATVNSLTIDAVTVTFDIGTNSNSNAPKYYASGEAVRAYGGNTFTISSGNTISKIVITFGSSDGTNEITTDSGDYSDGTWTGSANEITFTIGGSSGNRRIASITVTSAGGGASYYTGHTTTCSGSQQLATPTNLQATDITYNGATLTWDAVAGANSYKVVINGTENIANTNSYTTHALKQQTAYTWTVQAIGNGTTFTDSEISAEATFTTGAELIITWSVSTATSTTTITKGQPIGANLKTPATPDACEGKYFMGWSASSTVNSDGSDFTPITSATVPETNVTYYAVFAEPTSDGNNVGDLFHESFDTMNGKGGNDGEWSGNIATTKLESFDDWTLSSVYKASACIKLGTGSLAGSATTPALGINGNATLTFDAGAWNGNSEKLIINLTIVGDGSIEPSSVTLTKGQFNTYTANITGANADTKVQFIAANAANNRFFLDEVKVSGGNSVSYTDYSTSCGTYTVTFYGFNNGEYTTICNDNPAEIAVAQGETYQIPNCEPTDDPAGLGRTFAGTWNTQANGKGTAYEPGDEFIVNSDITLYAQWALNTSGDITLPTDVEDLATTDVVVTGGTTLTLKAGTTTINSLTLKGGLQENGTYAMPVVNIPTGATLVRNNNKINLDLKVNNKSYYPFAVPFEVQNIKANIHYLDEYLNSAATYSTHYQVLTYDGALRAENGLSDDNWVEVGRHTAQKPSYLVPGKGYAISAVPAKGETTTTIRISMDVDDDWFAGGEQISLDTITRNQIAVTAHTGSAADKDLCNAGWNFVANPYLTNFAANNISGAGYINGQIVVNNGKFEHNEEKIPYVTIPNANMSWYEQRRVEDAILSPMYSFFVQIAEGGTMTFTTAGRQQAPAALRASSEQANPSFEADIVILNNLEQVADHTGLVINDRWTPAYEIGGDLEKMFGTANRTAIYTLSGNTRLAYNALSYNDALVAIPIGFRAQADGEYTIQLSNTEDIVGVECIELKDLYNNQTTNLLYTDYTFYSDATQEDSRFVVYIVPQKNTPTDISTIINGNTENRKIIFNNHLYIIHNGNIYNGAGQMVK